MKTQLIPSEIPLMYEEGIEVQNTSSRALEQGRREGEEEEEDEEEVAMNGKREVEATIGLGAAGKTKEEKDRSLEPSQ